MPNLIDFLRSHNVPMKLHGEHSHATQNWVQTDCPFCSPNTSRYRLGFELQSGRTNCWACGVQNRVKALKEVCHIPYPAAIKFWSDTTPLNYTKPTHIGELKLPKNRCAFSILHKRYLINRGFDPNVIKKLWQVQGIGIDKNLRWRLFIPIHDHLGETVSWTTRSINPNNKMRYISAKSNEESVPHKSLLYGEHLARNTIVIVEGPLDAWAIGPGAVATCGISYSQSQFKAMTKYSHRIICFDAEKIAQKRAAKLFNQLTLLSGKTKNVVLETGSDPADADREEIMELRKEFLECNIK